MGRIAGPLRPPVIPPRCGRIRSRSMAIPSVVLMSVRPSAPAPRHAEAMVTRSVTSGLSFANTGRCAGTAARTAAMTAADASGSMAKTNPRLATLGHEMLTSMPDTDAAAGLESSLVATWANSSGVPPAIEANTRAPTEASHGRSSSAKASMPGPCRPIELSMPDGVSAIRGVPRPLRGAGMTVFVTNAPNREMSKNRCNSLPLAAQPDAVISGLGSVAPASVVLRSTISALLPAALRRRRPAPGTTRRRRRPTGPDRHRRPDRPGRHAPCGCGRRPRSPA